LLNNSLRYVGGAETGRILTYGNVNTNGSKKFLKLPNGIPSHDNRAARLGSRQLQRCFQLTKRSNFLIEGEIIALMAKLLPT